MWTIASASSAQLHHIRDSIYDCTRRMLDSLEAKDNQTEFTDIEHVQARVLLLVYDFMRTNHQRGWISAGRCFRLIQLMRLYEIDSPEKVSKRQRAGEQEDWVQTEVRRRTFWVAYSLDRYISSRHEWPLTLNEQDVSNIHHFPVKLSVGRYAKHGSRCKHVFPLPRRTSKAASMSRWDSCPMR